MTSKPELFARVEHTFSQLTPSEKRVAGWLLAHAAQIPFETADGIAKATEQWHYRWTLSAQTGFSQSGRC